MQPFDLEKAKAGEQLITREGYKVTEFHHFETAIHDQWQCVYVCEGNRYQVTVDGMWRTNGCESNNDILLADENDIFISDDEQ